MSTNEGAAPEYLRGRVVTPTEVIADGVVDIVRTTVAGGVALADVVRAPATTPATVLGDNHIGALEAGRRADILLTDDDFRVLNVWRAGQSVAP